MKSIYDSRGRIALDFDGVIHEHLSPFEHPEKIADGPVAGAFDFIRSAVAAGREVVILTARMNDHASRDRAMTDDAIRTWLEAHGLEEAIVDRLKVTHEKVGADVYIDDRGWRFDGRWPSLAEIDALQQWNRRAPGGGCAIKTRAGVGDGFVICGSPATHVVFSTAGRRSCCEEHASAFMSVAGFLVRPIEDVCETCGAINKQREARLYCWCGSSDGVERVKVDGLWFAVCKMHHPPPLASLWWRLYQSIVGRIVRVFRKSKQLSAVEIMELTRQVREKAKSR